MREKEGDQSKEAREKAIQNGFLRKEGSDGKNGEERREEREECLSRDDERMIQSERKRERTLSKFPHEGEEREGVRERREGGSVSWLFERRDEREK